MSGGYKTPAVDGADAVKRHVESHSDQIKTLQRPTGEQLADIIAEVNSLVINLIVPQVGSGSTNSYILTTTYQSITSFNFTVPAGCTRALIAAQGSVSCASSAADNLFTRVLINGIAGPESAGLTGASNYVYAIPAVAAASLTGLTAGAAISVIIQAHLTVGPGASLAVAERAGVTGTALFLP